MAIDHDLTLTIRIYHLTERTAVGCQADLDKDAIQFDVADFLCLTVLYTDTGHFFTVTQYLHRLGMHKDLHVWKTSCLILQDLIRFQLIGKFEKRHF